MEYDDMLDRAVEESPKQDADGARFEVPTPQVTHEGNVTVFENVQDVADTLNRAVEDLLQFIQNKFGTAATIDESDRIRLTGEFKQRRVADAVEAYTEAFVVCPACGLPDTRLVTEGDAELLKCDACGARSPTGR